MKGEEGRVMERVEVAVEAGASGELVTKMITQETPGGSEGTSLCVFMVCNGCNYEIREGQKCPICPLKEEVGGLRKEMQEGLERHREEVKALNEALQRVTDRAEKVISDMQGEMRERQRKQEEEVEAVKGMLHKAVEEGDRRLSALKGEVKTVRDQREREAGAQKASKDVESGAAGNCWGGARPKERDQGWRTVKGGKGTVAMGDGRTATVSLQNRFSVLQEEERQGTAPEGTGVGKQGKGKKGPEVLVVGDSRTRFLDGTFCEEERDRRMTVCLPGARVQDVTDRLERVVAGTGREAVVIVNVGVNDVGRKRTGDLVERYQALLKKMKDCGRKCVLMGVLPKLDGGRGWESAALEVNTIVRVLCEGMGVKFVDGWDRFFRRRELYARDGLHFSREGVVRLSGLLEGAVEGLCQGN